MVQPDRQPSIATEARASWTAPKMTKLHLGDAEVGAFHNAEFQYASS